MKSEAETILDSLEADIDRMRELDPALKASMLARLDRLVEIEKERPHDA
jgi:hypothetical protein